jgi:hypothetical protein
VNHENKIAENELERTIKEAHSHTYLHELGKKTKRIKAEQTAHNKCEGSHKRSTCSHLQAHLHGPGKETTTKISETSQGTKTTLTHIHNCMTLEQRFEKEKTKKTTGNSQGSNTTHT